MIRLTPTIIPEWPKLAWVAVVRDGADEVQVLCGPMVEINDDWIAEAVWAGDFTHGDFDQTDLVFGTGIRVRSETITFVSSGTTLDRLVYTRLGETSYVSNSLGALLAVSGLSLCPDYVHYCRDAGSIIGGPTGAARQIPADSADIDVVYFDNLRFDGKSFERVPKPESVVQFLAFADYRSYLRQSAEQIGENARSPSRRNRPHLMSTVSRGYDSTAAAVVARWAGCRHTQTIRQAVGHWRRSDSGSSIAHYLKMECQEVHRDLSRLNHEIAVWSVNGRPIDLNLTLLDYSEPLTVLFTGFHGDKFWERKRTRFADPLTRGDISGLGFCEFRLWQGVFHCAVPFWGARRRKDMQEISFADEMANWSLGNDYDRPVPRRLVEEQGVPRNAFGVRKQITVVDGIAWPYSGKVSEAYSSYRRQRNLRGLPPTMVHALRVLSHFEKLVHKNLISRLGVRKRCRPWRHLDQPFTVFHWANHELKQEYLSGIEAAGVSIVALDEAANR